MTLLSFAPRADLTVRMARDPSDLEAVQRLRYRVFVEELGGDGPGADHHRGLERDRFDAVARHLILVDETRPAGHHVVGAYRLIDREGAEAAGQFYSESEYDLAPLRASGRRLLELGRSCLDPAHRGGGALGRLWSGLAAHVAKSGAEVLFGVASFHGADPAAHGEALSLLEQDYLAPEPLRVRSRCRATHAAWPAEAIDRRRALLATPGLIKSYLRLGGRVGAGAFVDRAFNTKDVCMILDTAELSARGRALYLGAGGR